MPDSNNSSKLSRVNIRPGVSVLSVLRHLNYKPWFALAEFVDNAFQSFVQRRRKLEAIHGNDFKVEVEITIVSSNPGRISIKDNAGGIAYSDYQRAFRPAAVPTDTSGLSEFGMGMKSAACWFSPRWYVRTKSLGESVERTVRFDVNQIVHDKIEELEIIEVPLDENLHFTEVILEDLHQVPVGRTVRKIKDHLTDIYREFIRKGELALYLNGELLTYSEPKILEAPFFRQEDGEPCKWYKKIRLDFGEDLNVTGFAALRDPGNHKRSGFALFRRGRLIQGSGDEGYRPTFIFGQPGSFRSLRLFGELHFVGFEVSHTKDGFRWDENEQPFLDLLKEELDSDDLPLLRQADGYRVLAPRRERKQAAQEATDRTAALMANERLSETLNDVANEPPLETPTQPLSDQKILANREFTIKFRHEKWLIKIELTDEPQESQWLDISNQSRDLSNNEIEIRVNLASPFMVRFAQTDPDDVEVLLRIAAALALAETLARYTGHRHAGTIRRNFNEILREAFSQQ